VRYILDKKIKRRAVKKFPEFIDIGGFAWTRVLLVTSTWKFCRGHAIHRATYRLLCNNYSSLIKTFQPPYSPYSPLTSTVGLNVARFATKLWKIRREIFHRCFQQWQDRRGKCARARVYVCVYVCVYVSVCVFKRILLWRQLGKRCRMSYHTGQYYHSGNFLTAHRTSWRCRKAVSLSYSLIYPAQ
jgi:hypothetical protein